MALLPRHHGFIRLVCASVTACSLTYMAQRAAIRSDVTSEGLSRVTDGTKEVIRGISEDRPVVVTAYVSKEVPQVYVSARARLMNILREMEADGGPGLTVHIFEPEPHSEEAQEAVEKHGIVPKVVSNVQGGRSERIPIFMGVAFASGAREEIVPFLDRGLSVEYEMSRALRVVTQNRKKVVGVLRTDATLMGSFDITSRRQTPAWRIVDELKKQYEVRSVNPGVAVPGDVDVLMVPQVSSMTQGQLNYLKNYLDDGRPALLIADPMPVFNMKLSPSEPMLPPPGQGQMGGFGGGGAQPKGQYRELLRQVGVEWDYKRIVYDTHNPNPNLRGVPDHFVFVGKREDGTDPFSGADPTVEGLAQIVTIFSGDLSKTESSSVEFKPILSTGTGGGFDNFDEMVDRSNFLLGIQGPRMPRKRGPKTNIEHVIGARVTGSTGDETKVNAIVLADLDMFSDSFFRFHEGGGDVDGDGLIDLRFDNVTFLLNAIDTLSGDDRFIELRRRQPEFRRLEKVDQLTKDARVERESKMDAANKEAEAGIAKAKETLQAAVQKIKDQPNLDENTKAIMIRSAEAAENRRLMMNQQRIERDKAKTMSQIEREHLRKVDEVRDSIRLTALLLPPLPALLMGLLIYMRKRRRESSVIPENRKFKRGKGTAA